MPIAASAEELDGEEVVQDVGFSQKRDGAGIVTVGESPLSKATRTEAAEADLGAAGRNIDFEDAASKAEGGDTEPRNAPVAVPPEAPVSIGADTNTIEAAAAGDVTMSTEELSAVGQSWVLEDGGDVTAIDASLEAGGPGCVSSVPTVGLEAELEAAVAAGADAEKVELAQRTQPEFIEAQRLLALGSRMEAAMQDTNWELAYAVQAEIGAQGQAMVAARSKVAQEVPADQVRELARASAPQALKEKAHGLAGEVRSQAQSVRAAGLEEVPVTGPGADSSAAQRLGALEAELKGAVGHQDYARAAVLQAQVASQREAMRSKTASLRPAVREQVAAAGSREVEQDSGSAAAQRLVGLEVELQKAVEDKAYGRAAELQAEIASLRTAGREMVVATGPSALEQQSESAAAQRVAALEAELQRAVQEMAFARAAEVQAEIASLREAEQRVVALEADLKKAVQDEAYLRADELQTQIASARQVVCSKAGSARAAGRGQVAATGPSAVKQDADTAASQRISALQAQLQSAVSKQDYGRAGEVQAQIDAERQAMGPKAESLEADVRELVVATGAGAGSGAAPCEAKEALALPRPPAQPGRAASGRARGRTVTIDGVVTGQVLDRKRLTFENLFFLAAGKTRESQGGKGKGKAKGKGKGKGKGGGLGVVGQDSSSMIALWFGDAAADAICLVATPDEVSGCTAELVPGVALQLSHVDVHERFPKTLKWGADTVLEVASPTPQGIEAFPYEKLTEYVQHYAAMSWVESEECAVGTLVSLPVMVVDVEEQWDRNGVAYPKVHLVDLDRRTIGPLRMWDFSPQDVEHQRVYMIRGLRVAYRSILSEQTGQWVKSPSAGKVLECGVFTALEAVEHPSVTGFFT